MPPPPVLIIHERLARWARHLRPRLVGCSVRLVESRSADDLVGAARAAPCPLLLIDPHDRPGEALDALDRAFEAAPDALALVLDPGEAADFGPLARELGATLVLPARTRPPDVHELLNRWLPIARRRAAAGGWHPASETPADPDGPLDPLT